MSHQKKRCDREVIKHAIRSQRKTKSGQPVSFEARALWVLIDSFGRPDGQDAHPSVPLLMAITGHGKKWVERCISELRDAGLLTSKTLPVGQGWVNHYTMGRGDFEPYPVTAKMYPTGRVRNGPKNKDHPQIAEPPAAEATFHNAAASEQNHPENDEESPFRDREAC